MCLKGAVSNNNSARYLIRISFRLTTVVAYIGKKCKLGSNNLAEIPCRTLVETLIEAFSCWIFAEIKPVCSCIIHPQKGLKVIISDTVRIAKRRFFLYYGSMAWFKKKNKPLQGPADKDRKVKTEGLFIKCEDCGTVIWKKDLKERLWLCDKCGYHFRISARERLSFLFDEGRYDEFNSLMQSSDPLEFHDRKAYRGRLDAAMKATGSSEGVITASGTLKGLDLICAVMEYSFIGGSMGSVVGEKITRAVEMALETETPLLIVSSSGGARMMEGFLSLMQMAKISSALSRLDAAGIPYISLMADPTTGGVTASFAMLGDLNIAEPRALIGFAGPRVIEQTIRQKLPEDFQRSEFLLEHGMLDAVVPRFEQREFLYDWLRFMSKKQALG